MLRKLTLRGMEPVLWFRDIDETTTAILLEDLNFPDPEEEE